jgi:hypothetical protein
MNRAREVIKQGPFLLRRMSPVVARLRQADDL